MRFEAKYLSDVAFFQEGPGVRKFQFRDYGVKLLNVGNINNGILNTSTTKLYISEEEAYGKYSHFLVDEGDLIIASSGIVVDNFHNKIAFASKEHLPLCLNTSTIRFKSLNPVTFSLDYLKYYLKTKDFKNQLSRLITGSAQLNFGSSHLKKIIISVPKFEDQIRIANILSKAEALIKQRKESIDLLDEYLKSTFLEMFGDHNYLMSCKLEELGKNISFLTSGSRGWAQYYSDYGAKFLRIQNVGRGVINTENIIHINAPKSAEAERTRVQEGDLLISITADLGRTSVVPKDFGEAYINQHLALIRLNKNINPIYAAYFYNMPFGNQAIQRKNRAAVKAGLNFNDIKSLPIYIPQISEQKTFAVIVEKVEAIKAHYRNSLQELENLYGALSQKAFKGELNLVKAEEMLIAAEPEVKYGTSYSLLQAAMLAGYVIIKNRNHDFGRVKLMKLMFLLEYHLKLNIEKQACYQFFQKTAGPYNEPYIKELEGCLYRFRFFATKKEKTRNMREHIVYESMNRDMNLLQLVQENFSDKMDEIESFINLLKRQSWQTCEIVATLYAVWNNRIKRNESVSDSGLLTDFYNWSEHKQDYPESQVLATLDFMRAKKIIPTGFGKYIDKENAEGISCL